MKVIQIMPDFGLAGAERMCEALTLEIKDEVEVIVISLYRIHTDITDNLEKKGVKIIYLDKKRGLDLSMINKLYKIFKQIKPDVIHTHRYVMQYAIPAAIFAGIKKRIHTVHSVANKEVPNLQQKLHYIFYKYFNVIPVSISPSVQKSVINRYRLQANKTPIIYNGINFEGVSQKSTYTRDEIFTFLHVGRYAVAKNHIEMIKAFQALHKNHMDTKLLLIGEGELYYEVQQYISENNLSDCVKQLGLKKNVLSLYKTADVFILPSIYEGMPMTLIEAMATGMPIISTYVGGIPDMLINGESALLSTPNSDDIYINMLKMYNNEKLRVKLGTRAKKDSINYNSKIMAERYKKLYFFEMLD